MQFGVRAANYPFIADDMDNLKLPPALRAHQHKLFGLTIDPERLAAIRQERAENTRYASMRQCRLEVGEVEALFRTHQIRYLNSTNYSVEDRHQNPRHHGPAPQHVLTSPAGCKAAAVNNE